MHFPSWRCIMHFPSLENQTKLRHKVKVPVLEFLFLNKNLTQCPQNFSCVLILITSIVDAALSHTAPIRNFANFKNVIPNFGSNLSFQVNFFDFQSQKRQILHFNTNYSSIIRQLTGLAVLIINTKDIKLQIMRSHGRDFKNVFNEINFVI